MMVIVIIIIMEIRLIKYIIYLIYWDEKLTVLIHKYLISITVFNEILIYGS